MVKMQYICYDAYMSWSDSENMPLIETQFLVLIAIKAKFKALKRPNLQAEMLA